MEFRFGPVLAIALNRPETLIEYSARLIDVAEAKMRVREIDQNQRQQ